MRPTALWLLLLTLLVCVSPIRAMELPYEQWYPLLHDLAKDRKLAWTQIGVYRQAGEKETVEIVANPVRLHEFTPFILAVGKGISISRHPSGGRGMSGNPTFSPTKKSAPYESAKEAVAALLSTVTVPTRISLSGPFDKILMVKTSQQGVTPLMALPHLLVGNCTSLVAHRKDDMVIVSSEFTFQIKKAVPKGGNNLLTTLLQLLPQGEIETADDGTITIKRDFKSQIGAHNKIVQLFAKVAGHNILELSFIPQQNGWRLSGKLKN